MLCTLGDVKALLEFTHEEQDVDITRYCLMASNWLADWVGAFDHESGISLLERFVDREEIFPAHESFVRVRGYPVVSIGSIVVAGTSALLDDAEELVADEDYRLDGRSIDHLTNGYDLQRPFWLGSGRGFVRVTYSGGYAAPSDVEAAVPPTGWIFVPRNKRDAAAMVAMHLFRNNKAFGQQSINVGTAVIAQVVTQIPGLIGLVGDAFGHLRPVGLG